MRHLNYKHLHYFWVVARDGSIARASERLFLTPQTISGQIGELEDAIGEKLFTRTGRGLQLTEIGRLVFQYADEMFRLGSELKDVLDGRLPGGTREFAVGVSDAVPKLVAFRVLEPALRIRDPIRLVCHEGRFDELVAALALHKLDMVLADSPVSTATNLRAYSHPLGETRVTIFAPAALARTLRREFPGSLNGVPMLLPGTHSVLRRGLEQWMEREGITPRIIGEFDDTALMKVFGQAGVGVFAAPTAIEPEVLRQFEVQAVGRPEGLRERYYAVTAERKLKHPAVVAITQKARESLFVRDSADRDAAAEEG